MCRYFHRVLIIQQVYLHRGFMPFNIDNMIYARLDWVTMGVL